MIRPKSPCKDCPDRVPGCRDDCFSYLMFEVKMELWRKENMQTLQGESDYFSHVAKTCAANRKRRRKK